MNNKKIRRRSNRRSYRRSYHRSYRRSYRKSYRRSYRRSNYKKKINRKNKRSYKKKRLIRYPQKGGAHGRPPRPPYGMDFDGHLVFKTYHPKFKGNHKIYEATYKVHDDVTTLKSKEIEVIVKEIKEDEAESIRRVVLLLPKIDCDLCYFDIGTLLYYLVNRNIK